MQKLLGSLAVMLGLSAGALCGADWQPAASPLMTRWGKAVTPDNAWREYPRPQMVRAEWQCLNGLWDYAVAGPAGEWKQPNVENAAYDPLNRGLPACPAQWNGKILVPFAIESSLSGVGQLVRPDQLLWYHRQFELPAKWQGSRIVLHFDAVDWHAIVWVNGQKIGENKGGYNPFSFDITGALKSSGPQEVVLVVWDPNNAGDQAVGKQSLPELRKGFRYTSTTGIWQTVWLEPVPAVSIQDLVITPEVDQSAVEVTVNGSTGPSGGAAEAVKLQVLADGKLVAEGAGKAGEKILVKVPQPRLWSPDSPFLYDLNVQLGGDGVRSYFGLRKIEVHPDGAGVARIQLNGRDIFSFGPLDQGYWPDGVLTPPADAAEQADLQYLKSIGCNLVRLHIKVNPDRWYYWADKLGLMVWQDFVSMPKYGSTIRPSSAAQWQEEMKREMEHLHNHPSIVEWIVFNEGWGQHDTGRLTEWAMKQDPSRMVCDATGWTDAGMGNTYDIHDYSFDVSIARPGQLGVRAMSVGECGGFNVWEPGHLWGNYQARETIDEIGEGGRESYLSASTWEKRYAPWIAGMNLMRTLGLCAVVYTQISDVEHECNGWMTYDREVSKIPAPVLRGLHEQFYRPVPRLEPLLPMSAGNESATAFKKGPVRPPGERPFHLDKVPGTVVVRLDGTGTGRIFINGRLAKIMNNSDRAGYVPTSMAVLSPAGLQALHPGENVLKLEPAAGRGEQAESGSGVLDVGLYQIAGGE